MEKRKRPIKLLIDDGGARNLSQSRGQIGWTESERNITRCARGDVEPVELLVKIYGITAPLEARILRTYPKLLKETLNTGSNRIEMNRKGMDRKWSDKEYLVTREGAV